MYRSLAHFSLTCSAAGEEHTRGRESPVGKCGASSGGRCGGGAQARLAQAPTSHPARKRFKPSELNKRSIGAFPHAGRPARAVPCAHLMGRCWCAASPASRPTWRAAGWTAQTQTAAVGGGADGRVARAAMGLVRVC